MQFRGYDSAGIGTIDEEGKTVITKYASVNHSGGDCIGRVIEEAQGKHTSTVGVSHTRWGTHGAKIDLNAHPHTSADK